MFGWGRESGQTTEGKGIKPILGHSLLRPFSLEEYEGAVYKVSLTLQYFLDYTGSAIRKTLK